MLQQLPCYCKGACLAAFAGARLLPYKAWYILMWCRALRDWQAVDVTKHGLFVQWHCQA